MRRSGMGTLAGGLLPDVRLWQCGQATLRRDRPALPDGHRDPARLPPGQSMTPREAVRSACHLQLRERRPERSGRGKRVEPGAIRRPLRRLTLESVVAGVGFFEVAGEEVYACQHVCLAYHL